MAKVKDTRRIVSGVQIPEAGRVLRTFGPGEEDELEEVLTAGQLAHLLAEGAVEGDWSPKAKAPSVMPNSLAARAAEGRDDRAKLAAELDGLEKKRAEARKAGDPKAVRQVEREYRDRHQALRANLKGRF